MNYWDSVGRWINTLLVFIVGVLAFDTLFRLLEANEDNVIVAFARGLAVVFLVPFHGMFGEQDYVLTTLIGVLGYSLLAGIALGVLRSLQASRAQPAPPVRPDAPVVEQPTAGAPSTADPALSATGQAPERADEPQRPPDDDAEGSTARRRPDRAQTNGSRVPRTRPGADTERTRPASDGRERIRRGRPRDRAAKRASAPASEVDTGT